MLPDEYEALQTPTYETTNAAYEDTQAQKDAVRKCHLEAKEVRNFNRWGVATTSAEPWEKLQAQKAAVRRSTRTSDQAHWDVMSRNVSADWQREQVVPGSSGRTSTTAYLQDDTRPLRVFNIASRGLPSGAQQKWCFDRVPSLLPEPLLRDRGMHGRPCAGVPPANTRNRGLQGCCVPDAQGAAPSAPTSPSEVRGLMRMSSEPALGRRNVQTTGRAASGTLEKPSQKQPPVSAYCAAPMRGMDPPWYFV
eukprot:gnl/TRDRNA2_/TRDRNA2_188337_c0_seq1.p1 gnl/TRDRNA2_/TRDRNA2_188337_c0~~gnl/TRDRNA2_/TRDRNA2_188337_c0_seq1.p1  ORF type:complete len:261 (+),score=37.09 gnl/TRDRNA2_/TRDRNA2_188337_c0_seq1:36-785(+)